MVACSFLFFPASATSLCRLSLLTLITVVFFSQLKIISSQSLRLCGFTRPYELELTASTLCFKVFFQGYSYKLTGLISFYLPALPFHLPTLNFTLFLKLVRESVNSEPKYVLHAGHCLIVLDITQLCWMYLLLYELNWVKCWLSGILAQGWGGEK